MKSVFSTSGLARICSRHPWRTIGVWVIILLLAGFAASSIADVLTTSASLTTEPESVVGEQLLEDQFRGQEPMTETIIYQSDVYTVDDPEFQQAVEELTAELAALDGSVQTVTNYYETENDHLVSEDRQTTLIPLTMVGDLDEAEGNIEHVLDVLAEHNNADTLVLTVGEASVSETFSRMAEEDLLKGEAVGIVVALVILIIVFGALVAAGLPIVLAVVSIIVATGLTSILGRAFELSFFVQNIITMLGLAVGIDYSLFIIERYREERRRGVPKESAITIAGATATRAVVFSAGAVVLALIGMFFVPVDIFRSLGAGAVLVVISAVAATLTLVPAMLGLLGDKIEWPRKRNYPTEIVDVHADPAGESMYRGFWGRITRVVMARPIVSMVLAAGLLVALALPFFSMNTGFAGVETFPESDAKTAFDILGEKFTAGLIEPVEIVVDGSANDEAITSGIAALTAELESDPAYDQVNPVAWNESQDLALIEAFLDHDSNSPAAYDALAILRDEQIPAAFGSASDDVFVTGATAGNQDFFDAVETVTPYVFLFVLGLSFILLTLAFRSLVVPATAIIMNLLSVGAAYGILVLVFQKGYGASLFGFEQVSTIEVWLPIFLFTILFGLSMDYQVFILSRIREHYDQTGNNRESVAHGLRTTGKIITGAAVIMVAVFAGFAAGRLVGLQQMGFGLAVAVLIDATIVRTILVPSTMAILGKRNWFFPNWLGWLPDLRESSAAPLDLEPEPQMGD